ncbi:hypothetical protein OnM2_023102 [Erysiphe neolycopersici]|uniref:Homing endonuclease LAGLIDADG domain-containing protein n=1 Tax=Erysiphe neolycopersici TaxID=212602 RepID=A0A420I1Y4_9PEZI|nr:hypothetical protein OnM2_023102 [Erysiphe neolycopersici]
MEKIVQYLGSGKIYKYSKSAVHLSINNSFKENPLVGIKSEDYLDWCKIHELMLNRSHLTVKGMNIIREIKLGMNRGRKFEVKQIHNQRFFSYLSLFTFMMIVLVTANNFLLIIAANQSSMSAFLTNRVGDCFLTIGICLLIGAMAKSVRRCALF